MKKLFLLLVALTTIFAASPTGPGTFLLKRTATGQPVDLFYFDSVWNLGTGLRRSGDTIYLDYSGVLPGTYGDATHVPQVTIDSFGRVVNVTNVTISGGGGGGGTVTSVGLALPSSVFSISGSPVVGSGTLSGSFVNQAPNTAFMGPASTTGPPTFRAILPGDISFLTDSITAAKVYALIRIHDSLVVERTFDTTVARAITRDTAIKLRAQMHDTADVLRKYTRDRIKDSLVGIRAALPAYVRRIGDTITGPIVGTTATAAPLINITTTFGDLTNAAIRGTASAEGGAAIHGIATGINGAAIWGVSSNTGGDGGLFSGKGGAHAVRAIATGGGKAGLFHGDVEVVGATKLASSLTGILKANAGVVSVADTSDFPTRPYLPLAAGSGSPLTGVLYGQGLNFTTTADAPISVSHNLAGAFTHPFQAFNSGMVAGNQYNFDFGQSASTNNAGNFGFKYVGAGSSSNYVTLGLYGANDLLTITAAGVPKFSGLATAGFVRANASGQLSSSPMVAGDIPALDASKITTGTFPDARIASAAAWNAKLGTVTADATSRAANTFYAAPSGAAGTATFRAIVAADIPTLNQSTTGSAAKWTTPRTLTIGATGKAVDGSANVSWSLAEIGALASGGTAVNSSALGGVGSDYFVQGNGGGTLGHRTANLSALNTATQSGFFDAQSPADGPQGAVRTHMVRNMHTGGATTNQWSLDIAAPFAGGLGTEGYYVRTISAGAVGAWRQLWHTGNLTPTAIGALPLAGGTMNTGAQIKVVADVTTSTSTNTVFNSAPLLVSRASSSGSAVAAIGFFNSGLNGAALYYSTSSDFRYNRNDGSIATIWDNSNLTPSAIGAATITHAATHYAGGSDQITGQSLSGLRTSDSPSFAGLKIGGSGGTAPSTTTPLVVRNASGASIARVESGTTGVAVSQWANTDASWSFGVRSDALSGSPVGALVAADATSARMWVTSTGVVVPGQISAGTAILKTYTDINYFSLWGSAASTSNYTLVGKNDGSEAYLNGSTKSSLAVGASGKVIATASAVTFPLLAASTTRIATISSTGAIGATSWTYDGPWLSLANGGTVSGYTNFANDIGTQRQFVGDGDIFVRAGAVLLRVGDGNDWANAAVQFPSTSTVQSFRVDGGAQFNSAVQFTAGAVHGASKQIATHLYSTSSTLPALAQGEWCWVVMDQSGGGSAYWSTPSTRSLRYYEGGTTTTLVPTSTQMVVPNNGTAWILYGPAYSGTTQMTLVM